MIKLKDAKCPNCGANMQVNDKLESTICQYCGSQVVIEEAIEKYKLEISGKVEVDGINSISKLYKNAESYIKLEDYKSALNTYYQIIRYNPEEIEAYKGVLLTISRNMTLTGSTSYPSCWSREIETYPNYITKLDKKSEYKDFVEKFNKYIEEQSKIQDNEIEVNNIKRMIEDLKLFTDGLNFKTEYEKAISASDKIIKRYDELDENYKSRLSDSIQEIKTFRGKVIKERKFFNHGIGLVAKWYLILQVGGGLIVMISEFISRSITGK